MVGAGQKFFGPAVSNLGLPLTTSHVCVYCTKSPDKNDLNHQANHARYMLQELPLHKRRWSLLTWVFFQCTKERIKCIHKAQASIRTPSHSGGFVVVFYKYSHGEKPQLMKRPNPTCGINRNELLQTLNGSVHRPILTRLSCSQGTPS
jgi:hypothetical protein